MTVIGRATRAICQGVAAGLLGVLISTVPALPTANADPQQCNTTFGESVDQYLQRHPNIKAELAKKGQAESPGSPNPVLDYLNRHPDVRQALITLSQQCTS